MSETAFKVAVVPAAPVFMDAAASTTKAITGQDMFDLLCDTPEKTLLLNADGGKPGGGYSMIFAPDGKPLVEHLPQDHEGILYADIVLAMIPIAKAAYDPSGHYARGAATSCG